MQAAALTYYGKTVDELSLAESAQLAGLVRAPSQNPVLSPEHARWRRLVALERMYDVGFITRDECQGACAEELKTIETKLPPHFFSSAEEHVLLSKLAGKTILLSGPFILN